MNHDAYREQLSALLDGELGEEARAEALSHLETCEDCRQYFAELTAMHDALGDMEPIDVPAGFARGVLLALGTAVLWGGTSPISKYIGSHGVSMVSVMCYRALLVVLLVGAWLRYTRGRGWYRISRPLQAVDGREMVHHRLC